MFDIEDDDIQSVVNKKMDIIYIDSTLTMLFKPFDCLRELFKFCDTIYLKEPMWPKQSNTVICGRVWLLIVLIGNFLAMI